MSSEKNAISDAELEIMNAVWQQNSPVSTQFINNAVRHKQWKRTTVSTLLSRLIEKGALKSEKRGNSYYYSALISQKEYRKSQTKNLITNLYNGSVRDLAVSLFEENGMSQEDIDEIRKMFDL